MRRLDLNIKKTVDSVQLFFLKYKIKILEGGEIAVHSIEYTCRKLIVCNDQFYRQCVYRITCKVKRVAVNLMQNL